ncbi:lipopolysaccharide transport periplasmic protein LptA [Ottowia sp.]|uniref:lipopolysaccharide transport periplasmic protein LptA n=1 Tax=Ottowia sp. TaxID=1898956 RepID=UPI003A8C6FAF
MKPAAFWPLRQPIRQLMMFTALTGCIALPTWAERTDRDQPMHIESDALRYEDQKQLSTFTGRVVVTKGTIVLRGARLEVRQDPDGFQYGTMYAEAGQRALFRQKRDGVNEFIEGEAETIDYNGKTDTMRLTRRAEMRRLAGATKMDEVMGAVITYNNTTEVYTVDGQQRAAGTPSAAPSGRVRAVLAPRNSGSAPQPAASAPAATLRPSSAIKSGPSQ